MLRLRCLFIILLGGLLCLSASAQTPIDVLTDDPELSIFVDWINATNVSLSDQPFTLFAPTNDAILSLPTSVQATLEKDTALLTRVVEYHLIAGAQPAATLESGTLETQEGDALTLVQAEAGLTVDGVLVTEPDAGGEGLVVHKIEGVLLPPILLPNIDTFDVSGDIVSAGSSTVHPLTQRMADIFSEQGYSDTILVDNIGTGAGFERFGIAAETDIANASRGIRAEEVDACVANDREPLEFRVGTDALAIVVSSENDFVDELTLEELAQVFGEAKTWQDVRAEWPAEPIALYSPGTDSGTFDYFVEEVFDNDPTIPLAAQPITSEDDEALVRGVEESPYAISYFGYAYYLRHTDRLKLVAINGIIPSEVSAEDSTYPLARPLYIYSAASIFEEKPEVAAFIHFYLNNVNSEILNVGYFPASERALNLDRLLWLSSQSS